MTEYKFDAVRWCKSRARTARAQRNFADENSFVQVAREVEGLRAEVAALKAAAVEARDSITCLCAEGPEFMKASEIREAIVKDVTKLARLCGEGR